MKKLLHWLWPNYCLLCKSIISNFSICSTCIDELPWNEKSCSQCGLPLAPERQRKLCGTCIIKLLPFKHTTALFTYNAPITHFVTQLKFKHQLLYANVLGNLLAKKISETYTKKSLPECIIPVPLHRRRLRQRGFNQALEISKPLAKQLQLPLIIDTCIRCKYTQPQSKLPAKKRQQNIKMRLH